MNAIRCKIFREEMLFDNVFTAEAHLMNDTLPYKVGVLNNIQLSDGTLLIQHPAYYVKISENENLHRIFYTSSKQPPLELKGLENPLFTLWPSTKKVLLFINEESLFESLAILHFLHCSNIEFRLYIDLRQKEMEKLHYLQKNFLNRTTILSSFSEKVILPILRKQLIGTRLFISGQWTMVEQIKQMAYNAGFSDEEIQFRGIGKQNDKIFCVRCYQVNNRNDIDEQEPVCEYCQTALDISRHYSKRLNAYLGYVKL